MNPIEQEKDLLNEIKTYHDSIEEHKHEIKFHEDRIEYLEKWISECQAKLEALKK